MSKRSSNLALGTLLVGGAVAAAVIFAGKEPGPNPPPPPTPSGPNALDMFDVLKEAASVGTIPNPYRVVLARYPGVVSIITAGTDLNGNIGIYDMDFPDNTRMKLYIDYTDKIKIELINDAGGIVEDYVQPGFTSTIRPTPTIPITSYVAGSLLATSDTQQPIELVYENYELKIRNVAQTELGEAPHRIVVYDILFNDTSRMKLQVDSDGDYSLECWNNEGDSIFTFTRVNFTPYAPPVELTQSEMYRVIYNVVNRWMVQSVGTKSIEVAWLDIMGNAHAVNTEQRISGRIIHNRQYDVEIHLAVIPEEPEVGATLIYDENSPQDDDRFQIYIYYNERPDETQIKTHDTFPGARSYDRTKTMAWASMMNMQSLYLGNLARLTTLDNLVSTWRSTCESHNGVKLGDPTQLTYSFGDKSFARLLLYQLVPRQFRIIMTSQDTDSTDENLEIFKSDFFGKIPTGTIVAGGEPHQRLASYLRAYFVLQQNNKELRPFITPVNLVSIFNDMALRFYQEYNEATFITELKCIGPPVFGEISISNAKPYSLHYALYVTYDHKLACFMRYENIGGVAYIMVDIVKANRYDSHGIDRLTVEQMWGWVLATGVAPYFVSNGFRSS